MLTVDLKEFARLAKALEREAPDAMRFAMADAMTGAAFEARKAWSGNIRDTFTVRAQWVGRGALEVVKAKPSRTASNIESVVGSTAAFMDKQEFGGVSRGKMGGTRPIAAPSAAGQAPGGKRTRLVRAANTLAALSATRVNASGSRKQRNAVALRMAAKTGKRVVVLERPGTKGPGVFSVRGGKKPKTRLLWAFRNSPRVEANPTLGPAVQATEKHMLDIGHRALVKQMQRRKILGF